MGKRGSLLKATEPVPIGRVPLQSSEHNRISHDDRKGHDIMLSLAVNLSLPFGEQYHRVRAHSLWPCVTYSILFRTIYLFQAQGEELYHD